MDGEICFAFSKTDAACVPGFGLAIVDCSFNWILKGKSLTVIRDRVFCLPLDGTIVIWTGHGFILHRAERAPAVRLWGLNTTSSLPH